MHAEVTRFGKLFDADRYDQRQPERLDRRRQTVDCRRRSAMKTRLNEVSDESRRPPLDELRRCRPVKTVHEDLYAWLRQIRLIREIDAIVFNFFVVLTLTLLLLVIF